MLITIIPPENVINHFDRIKELVGKLDWLMTPEGRPSDLIADMISGSLTTWGVFDEEKLGTEEEPLVAVCVTQKRDYWRCSALEILALSGEDWDAWLDDLNEITIKYAFDLGCVVDGKVYRKVYGRLGWSRKLAKYGFVKSDVTILECLSSGRQEQQSAD